MITVKNLTASPYDLLGKDGPVRLPAFGEVSGEFPGEYLQLLEASMAVKVLSAPTKADPLDHDGNGKKGGSTSPDGDADEASRLRAEYQDLFKKRPFNGWDAQELQRRIDEKLGE